jgi:hypothetical protein
MSTVIRQAIELSIEQRSEVGGEISRIMYANIAYAKNWINAGSQFARSDIFGDLFYATALDNIELDALATILVWIDGGLLTACRIQVGNTPGYDRDVEYNNQCIKHMPAPFSGCFKGGDGGDNDGQIRWNAPVNLNMIVNGTEYKTVLSPETIPDRAPLEVGYTNYSTSYQHLIEEGALARWAYGSEDIYLLHYSGKTAAELVSYAIDP